MSLSLSVQFIGPAGLFRKAGPVLALPEELLLGVRYWSSGALPGAQCSHGYWREVPKWGWLAGPRRFRGHSSVEFPEQPTDLHSCVLEAWIIAFPSPRVLTDVLLDAFIPSVINLFISKLGSCYNC